MKILVVSLVAVLAGATALGQGKINLVNDLLHLVYYDPNPATLKPPDAALAGTGPDSANLPSGIILNIGLYGGTSSASLTLLTTITFGATEGQIPSTQVVCPFVGGVPQFFQVQVWDSNYPNAAAASAGGSYFAYAQLFQCVPGSSFTYNSLVNSNPPANSTWPIGSFDASGFGGAGARGAIDVKTSAVVLGILGDVDSSGSTITIGDVAYNARAFMAPNGYQSCTTMYVGYSNGYTATYTQTNGTLIVASNWVVGANCPAGANGAPGFVTQYGGTTYVTNAAHTAVLDVRNGTFNLSGGTLIVDNLVVTNACGRFIKNGGQLIVNTATNLGPYMDADGDGMLNWQEARAGTDPLDPTSVFRLVSATRTNRNDLRVDWTTVGGHSYVVQTNGSLGRGAFSNLSGVISVPLTSPGTTNYVHVGGATNGARFYRILLTQ